VAAVRNSARALVVAGALSTLAVSTVAVAAPAGATVVDTAYDAGSGLTVSQTLGLFVGIPLLVILVVYGLVYGLTGRRGPRYPAGPARTVEPEVFGDAPTVQSPVDVSPPSQSEGGARGRW
jgi:hypothetical protein